MAKRKVPKKTKKKAFPPKSPRVTKPTSKRPSASKPKPATAELAVTERITASAADKLAGGKWFAGYTKTVAVVDARTIAELDGEQRCDAAGGPEYVIFKYGLAVTGDVRVGDYHSITVVLGDLKARSIVSGDAVFIVTGDVIVSDYVLNFRNEGLFLRGTEKLPAIRCPLVFWYDRNKRETVLQHAGTTTAGDAAIAALLASDYSKLDMDELQLKPRLITEALASGRSIFK